MTNEPTADELRELDAWIGEHVFEKHAFEPSPSNDAICASCSHHISFEDHFVKRWTQFSNQLPRYTTDPAAAMMVQKECAKKIALIADTVCTGLLIIHPSEQDPTWTITTNGDNPPIAEGVTFELAICRFAKALFGEGKE